MAVETSRTPSEALELRTSRGACSLPRTTSLKASCHGSNVCLQCGKITLSTPGFAMVWSKADCAQVSRAIEDTVLQDPSAVLLSDARRLMVDHAPLYDLLPSDLTGTPRSGSIELKRLLGSKGDGADLGARIGVLVFFRLLKSLEERRNTEGILKLIRQVPSVIADTRLLSLSPHVPAGKDPRKQLRTKTCTTAFTGLVPGACRGGVVDAIMSAAEGLLSGEHDLSNQQQGQVLEAMVGLAVKRGSPAHSLRVIKLILWSTATDQGLSIPGVGKYLKELQTTKSCPLSDGLFRDRSGWCYSDNESCEAGNLLFLHEEVEPRADGGRLDNCGSSCDLRCMPPVLQEVDVLKVTSTTNQHVVLTGEGKLLTWSCTHARGRQAGKVIAAATSALLPVMGRILGVPNWRTRSRGLPVSSREFEGSADGTNRAVFNPRVGCAGTGHLGRPFVRQVLAFKPNVTDVACGQGHSLALLETGQVFSWGSGRNGRLGLGDTRDRLSPCRIEAFSEIEIEGVFCGVSHSMAVSSIGTSYAWGKSNCGQCGNTNPVGSDVFSPRTIEGLQNFTVIEMAGGREHTLALTRCGGLFSFGSGLKYGDTPAVLGISAAAAAVATEGASGNKSVFSPTRVCEDALDSSRVTSIAAGWDHCLAVTDDGGLLTWGSGRDGQLGHGDIEPRNVPTHVTFFGTPDGGRVRSASGGRTYSAASTVDGRVFKWGLSHSSRPSREKERRMDEEASDDHGDGLSEADEVAANEVAVPRQVPGIGMEGPRVVRVGEGENFGMIIVEPRSTTASNPPIHWNGRGNAATQQMATTGLDIPDDASQPVGQVETALALLRHIERLAIPHMPRNDIVDVDRSVRQAVRVGKRIQKRLLQAGPPAHVAEKADKSLSALRADEDSSHPVPKGQIPDGNHLYSTMNAPMCSSAKFAGRQEPVDIASRIPLPVAPFCVDTSLETFRSFLELIKVAREARSPVLTCPTRAPGGITMVDSSTASNGKRMPKKHLVPDALGPESCVEPTTNDITEIEHFGNKTSKKQHADPATKRGFAVASREIKMEVLSGTLKLLKVNLFHLVRVAAIRSACRRHHVEHPPSGQIGGKLESVEPRVKTEDRHDPGQKRRVGNKKVLATKVEGNNARMEFSRTPSSSEIVKNVTRDSKTTLPVSRDEMFEIIGQGSNQDGSVGAKDVQGVIGELFFELQAFLEEGIVQEDPGKTSAALAVQIEAAEAFRVGFSVFFPSNFARVRLLKDVVAMITTTGSVPPEHTQEHVDGKGKRQLPDATFQQRVSLGSKPSSLMMELAVEALTRHKYAAGIVFGALDNSEAASGQAYDAFDATELDAVMESLLSYCARDLQRRLWAGQVGSKKVESGSLERPFDQNSCNLNQTKEKGCIFSRLLLVLQEHILAGWSSVDGDSSRKKAARDLSLAHASRLLEHSLNAFTTAITEREQGGARENCFRGNGQSQLNTLTNSFVSLVPVLCTSVAALPTECEDFLSRSAGLLPLVFPLMRAVDRFGLPDIRTTNTAAPAQVAQSPSSWLTELVEALAMLSSDLVCGLIDMETANSPQRVRFPAESSSGERDDQGGRNQRGNRREDNVDLLLSSSPFLAFGRESFDWSGLPDKGTSQVESADCILAREGFIQDLFSGQGAAQALYQWMTATPESQLPVLHATSLATQGQGWGSYQSLSSQSGSDQQGADICHQRRRCRALSSSVDAATRALVAVMIKNNGAVAEAATFARCRLDRASSPPRALKLVAAAAAEVHEALAGLADSLEAEKHADDNCVSGVLHKGQSDEGGTGGHTLGGKPDCSKELATGLQMAITTLANIVRNCRFLLKCTTRLPPIDLSRKGSQADTLNYRRQRPGSNSLADDRQIRRELSQTLRRWAVNARNTLPPTRRLSKHLPDEGSATDIALIVRLMAQGRVERALSASIGAQMFCLSSRSASLESLVGFAASPLPLHEIETRMHSKELREKVRVSAFLLIHATLNETRVSAARQQIGARLTRSLNNVAAGLNEPPRFAGATRGGATATARVRSAYFDLFRHIVYEVKEEHSNFMSQGSAKTTDLTPLVVSLPLLETLATVITPWLQGINPSNLFEEQGAKSGSSPPRPGPAASKSANIDYQNWPGRTGRVSSCPAIIRTDVCELAPTLTSDRESIPALTAAIPVVGAVLGGQGDILTSDKCVPRSFCQRAIIHHAAWRSLGVISAQLCSMTHSGAGGCREPPRQAAGGRQGSSPKELERHNTTREWWIAIQSTLRVVCDELVRARDCLEKVGKRLQEQETLMVATGAVRLALGPLTIPATWTTSGMPEEDGSETGTVSFWVWGPTHTTKRCQDARGDMLRGYCCAGKGNELIVFSQTHKVSSSDTPCDRDEQYSRILLTQSSPCRNLGGSGGTGTDLDEFYVEIDLGRRNRSKQRAERKGACGGGFDGRGEVLNGNPEADGSIEKSGDQEKCAGDDCGGHGHESGRETFFSEHPLPPGKWTHVCCMYFVTEGGSGSDRNDTLQSGCGGAIGQKPSVTDVRVTFDGKVIPNRALSSCATGHGPESTSLEMDHKSKSSGTEFCDMDQRRSFTSSSDHIGASDQWERMPVVCDVHWHREGVSPEQVHQMAENGIPTQLEDEQRGAENYVGRLVGLAEVISAPSQRVASALSNPRWLSLWLQLISLTGHQVKRAIIRLLCSLLCIPNQPIDDGVENLRTTSKAPPDSPPAPPSTGKDFSDRAVVHRLCSLLGGCLPFNICHGSQRIPIAWPENPIPPQSTLMTQESSIVSEVVRLLRLLVIEAPNRWREHVFGALTDGLAIAAKRELSTFAGGAESERRVEADQEGKCFSWLGPASAAVYLGGGHIEGLRLGARVVLLPSSGSASSATSPKEGHGVQKPTLKHKELREKLGDVCISAITSIDCCQEVVKSMCQGTLVGRVQNEKDATSLPDGTLFVAVDAQYEDCLDGSCGMNPALREESLQTSFNKGSSPSVEGRCRVVAVQAQKAILQAEATEPEVPFLFKQALPSVLTFLELPTAWSPRRTSSLDETEPGTGVSEEIGAQLFAAHIRCRLVRALAVQLCHAGQAAAAVRGKVLRPLLSLGATPLASAVDLALGSDGAVAFGRRSDFASILISFGCQRTFAESSLRSELESACQVVWNRLVVKNYDREGRRPQSSGGPTEHSTRRKGCCRSNGQRPTLQLLGGEALIEGNRVTASSHFPTIHLSHVGVRSGSIGGRWYYEVTLLTGGLMQLGWAGPMFQCRPTRGQGVGDNMHSWSFDGFRQKRWCVSSAPYGTRWRAGDVVGVLLDASLQEMRFSLNGRDLGVAFVGFNVEGLYPAASMNVGQAARFNFGHSPFLYTPIDSGGTFQPISAAQATTTAEGAGSASVDCTRSCRQSLHDASADLGEDPTETDPVDDDTRGDAHELLQRRTRNRDVAVDAGQNNAHSFSIDAEGSIQRGEDEGSSSLELERQRLVESLIGMGFPIEWAIRAAGRSGSVMSESAATAWIIERLEAQNTKMEEEMGTTDTCEEDSAGGNSGIGDEYTDDAGESDDGDADTGGFVHGSEAARVESRAEEGAARADDEAEDRRWHNMYSVVRRSFLDRSEGESPATAAAAPPGAAAQTGWVADGSVTASPTAPGLLAAKGTVPSDGLRSGCPGLASLAMSASEADLPSLSLVLDTALSILFARLAVVNLLTHVGVDGGQGDHAGLSASYLCPCLRFEPSATEGPEMTVRVGEGVFRALSGHGPWGGAEMIKEIAQGILDALVVPEDQRRIVDLTKALTARQAPSRSTGRGIAFLESASSVEETTIAPNTTILKCTKSMENSLSGVCFNCANATGSIGLFPGSCLWAMRSLFELVIVSVKPSSEWNAWIETKRSPPWRMNEDPPTSNSDQRGEEASRTLRLSGLARLVKLFIREAISAFDDSPLPKAKSIHTSVSTIEEKSAERRDHGNSGEAFAHGSKYSWALWVLETLLLLEARHRKEGVPTSERPDGGCASTEPDWSVGGENDDTGDELNSILNDVASARSPRAFAAIIRSAVRNDLDDALQASAYSLCARMLTLPCLSSPVLSGNPPVDRPEMESTADGIAGNTDQVVRSVLPERGWYDLPSQEHALAREFSKRLRSEISTASLPSGLLQSQLELLAQWEFRRSSVNSEALLGAEDTHHRSEQGWEQEETKAGDDKPPTPEAWINITDKRIEDWDVATSLFAGAEEIGDGNKLAYPREPIAPTTGRVVRMTESEASALSTLPAPCTLEKDTPADHIPLLVEAVSTTSVTVSWGGWFETSDEPGLQVQVGSDGIAYPLACGKLPGVSDLAQALRSKLKHAATLRQDGGPRLILTVCACGLWGSEPFRVAALNLGSRGCLKVNGLVADTHYDFRLERRAVTTSPAPPVAGATDLSDDERSYFAMARTAGVNSTGGSSGSQVGTDNADGASVLTGLDGSGVGGGGTSTCSEECTTVLTDESRRQEGQASYCTSSTRAVAGSSLCRSSGNRHATKHMEFQLPPMGGRDRLGGTLEDLGTERTKGTILATTSVATPPEVPCMLDPGGCGPNLRLTNSNLTVTNTGRKKWSAVRASRGFNCGLHQWKARIDRCVSKNVFVGVVSSESRLNNYIGSDRSGWGYLANKAIWHNKGKVRSYGELFREGDVIGVSLNMDLGTLRFARNGRDLGMAVQGLEGTLYPAFSMYNRNDQLTFIPLEDVVAPSQPPSPIFSAGEKDGARLTRVVNGVDFQSTSSSAVCGTFSAECVVRRASKVIEVLGVLSNEDGLASPAGVDLVDNVHARYLKWSRREHGRSVSSARACAPVRVDTSEQACREFFGLGVGDRILSAEGDATVLGATKHSLWVELEGNSLSSMCSPGVRRGPGAWESEMANIKEADTHDNHGRNATTAEARGTSSPSETRTSRNRGIKVTAWSRSTVRHLISRPEDYVISRHSSTAGSAEPTADEHGSNSQHDGTSAAVSVVFGHLRKEDIKITLPKWTPAMDETLGLYLANLAESAAVASPLDLPYSSLEKLLSSPETFPSASPLTPAEIAARGTLMLYVNDLILPLLPFVDTSSEGRGPLSALLKKCRHLLLKQTKTSILDKVVGSTAAEASSESTSETVPTNTISIAGVKSLPRSPSCLHASPAKLQPLSWAQTSREIDKSVFGQVAKHLSHRGDIKHTLSEVSMAFFVTLTETFPSADREVTTVDDLHLLDARALYRGVFWQVCTEVFSPPICMFVPPPPPPVETPGASRTSTLNTPHSTSAEINHSNINDEGSIASQGTATKTTTSKRMDGWVPNHFFTCSKLSPLCMEPERVALYRSLGVIVGVAVRTGVKMPGFRLSPKWWMLVSNDGTVGGERAPLTTSKAVGAPRLRPVCQDAAASSTLAKQTPTPPQSATSTMDGMLTSLAQLEGTGLGKEEIDEILADARFVAPLSNGHVTELLPGGINRHVTSQNLGEYRARLARLGASEYAPQASAFRVGLGAALPESMLSLLTWRELEELVCGGSSDVPRSHSGTP